mgnify:CR=1 FL=1
MGTLGEFGKWYRRRQGPGLRRHLLGQLEWERGHVVGERRRDPSHVQPPDNSVGVRRDRSIGLIGHERPAHLDLSGGRRGTTDRRRLHRERDPASNDEDRGSVPEDERRHDEVSRFAVEAPAVHEHLALDVIGALRDGMPIRIGSSRGRGILDEDGCVATLIEDLGVQRPALLEPAGREVRVRSVQVHDSEVERADSGQHYTTLGSVPKSLPSLLRAYKIGKRVAAVGFEWATAKDVVDKIEEEVAELRDTLDKEPANAARAEEEMGDLFFALANLSRRLGIEPEAALRKANEKFTKRFNQLEANFTRNGRTLDDATLEEMDAEWQKIKANGI